METYNLNVNIDRYDKNYQQVLNYLLDKETLIKHAEILRPDDKHINKYEKKILIKFSGLSGLSIIGGNKTQNNVEKNSEAVTKFLNLISNYDGIVEELNSKYKTYLDVKLLFAYPYSDFMYSLIEAEKFRPVGTSIACLRDHNKYEYDFHIPHRLSETDIQDSTTFIHLRSSLDRIQQQVNASNGIINKKETPNRVIVKLCPINVLTCFLKINHSIFIDPYVYSKNTPDEQYLSLISPISSVDIPDIPIDYKTLPLRESKIYEHYCSLISHFRYLWNHPLTLYSTDATSYNKGQNKTLSKIKSPKNISYLTKSEHIERLLKPGKKYSQAEIDLWRQHCKNELIRHCSKFIIGAENTDTGPDQTDILNINPVKIFIVGAWKNNQPNEFMTAVEEFLKEKFYKENSKGLRLEPELINAENGTEFRKIMFEGLNSSQLAIVIQTDDYPKTRIKFSRPNVYIEKGYLMGRLGKKSSRSSEKEDQEPVFVFIKEGTEDGSDTNNITQTSFTNMEYFKLQFFAVVKWLWEISELNSEYALELLNEYEVSINKELTLITDQNKTQTLTIFLNFIRRFKTQIVDWMNSYNQRITRLESM